MQVNLFHRIQKYLPVPAGEFLASRITQDGSFLRVNDWKVIAAMLVGFGVVLRLIPYLHNRSLWLDETWLALNILQKSFSQLGGILDLKQMAPVGFLFIEKTLILNFGESEHVLRLFPLLAGILSLFLFYGVARRTLTLRGQTIALGLFAISEPLIRFSSELKQYSSDVMIALAISLLGLVCLKKESRFIFSICLFSSAGALFIWFSHPAIFSLAGVGIALTLYCLRTQKWDQVAWLSLPAAFWLGSFALNYFMILDLSQNPKMVKAWSGSPFYMPILPLSVQDLLWFPKIFLFMFSNPGGFTFYGLAAFCFVIGWISTFSEKRYVCYILTFPFVFTLLASGLHKYPFADRLILFLVPTMLLFIGEGVDRIITVAKPTGRIVWVSLSVLLFLVPTQKAISTILNPGRIGQIEEARPVMSYLGQHYQKGDMLFLYHASWGAYEYYAKRFGLEDVIYQRGMGSRKNWDSYVDELNGLRGNDRVWILFSHVENTHGIDEEKFFLFILDSLGTQVESFKRTGASVYLYDLQSDAPL